MKKYISLIQKSALFTGFDKEEIQKICTCLDVREKEIAKDMFVFRAGDDVRYVYLVLSGKMHIIDEDFWGNRSIIETVEEYTLFGEAYSLTSKEKHLVGVVAAENSTMLEINPVRLFETCSCECATHSRLIKNTAYILSEKIVRLTQKLGHIAKRSIREKILSYLSICARQEQNNSFYILYSRQQLADYLCIDRSALSHELSRLRDLGLIQYRKNYFELNVTDELDF